MADSTFLQAQITPLQQMISSCTGALFTSVFVTPLDVVKIRLQAQQRHSTGRCFLRCNGFVEELCCLLHAPPPYHRLPLTGTLDAFAKITRAEGVASLWSGLPPTLLMAVPSTVAYFTVYDQIRYGVMRRRKGGPQPLWLPLAAGGAARAISATLISPLELVRTKMQSQKLSYVELWCAVREEVCGGRGVRALWRGLGPTVLRDVPFSGVYWLSYEWLKAEFRQQTPTFWFSFWAGATSGTAAALLTLPFDVIKTHRQIELGEASSSSSQRAVSTYSLMKKLYHSSGYRALFAGGVPRVVKVAPACAIMISTYEYGKRFFHLRNTAA